VSARVLPGADAFRFEGGSLGFLLQHGFTGCPASMRPFGEWLSRQGASVVAPRLPGHGTTWEDLEGTTWRQWERETESALAHLSVRCTDVVAVGLSAGGALAVRLATRHPDKLRGIVAINALIRRPDLNLASTVRLFARSVRGVGNDIKKPGQNEIVYERVPLRAAAELGKLLRAAHRDLPSMTLPLLAFSAPEDHTVKPKNSRRLIQRAGSVKKELVGLPNSYHVATLDYDADMIFERTLEFARSLVAEREAPPTAV
jgi:carboxylesterase